MFNAKRNFLKILRDLQKKKNNFKACHTIMNIRKIIFKINFSVFLSQILGKLINYLYCIKKKNSMIFIPVDRDFFNNPVKTSVYSKICNNAKKFERKVFILKQWLTN